MSRALIVLTGSDHWALTDGSKHPTGFWAYELVAVHRALSAAGHPVAIATPGGVTPHVDQASLAPATVGGVERVREVSEYLDDIASALLVPLVMEDEQADDVGALVLIGGHAAMEDLSAHRRLGGLVVQVLDAGRLVVAVSHGVAALLPAQRPGGHWALDGWRLTAFTDEEEQAGGLAPLAPWLLESQLRASGAQLDVGTAWAPHVVLDRNLLTGQNPASSEAVAAAAVEWLSAH